MNIKRDDSKPMIEGEHHYFQAGGANPLTELHVQMRDAIRQLIMQHPESPIDYAYELIWKLEATKSYLLAAGLSLGKQAVRMAFVAAVRQYVDHKAFIEQRNEPA